MSNFQEQLHRLIHQAIEEDVGEGDHSTLCCIPPDVEGDAVLKIKEDGILAGLAVAQEIFAWKEPDSRVVAFRNDGDFIHAGETAFNVHASVQTILKCERLVLNCMQRMSGIATLTRQFVEALKGFHTRILDTRKTTPNFRLLEKEAVRIGGGTNHRFGLFDMILLKDNHIDYCGSLERAIQNACDYVQALKPGLKIEVEARTVDDVKRIIVAGKGKVSRIMLDNFTPAQLAEALKIMPKEFESEASGGIHLENVKEYANTGVDFISVGGLIHQARSLDMSLKAVRKG